MSIAIKKVGTAFDARMLRLQTLHENKIRVKIDEWFDYTRTEVSKGINSEMIQKRLIQKDQAANIVSDIGDWEAIMEEGVLLIKPVIFEAHAAGAQQGLIEAGSELTYDKLNPAAIQFAETATATMVREVTDETQEALRWVIREGLNKGRSIPQIGKEIKSKVGLTLKQVQAVANFEEKYIVKYPSAKRDQIDRAVVRYEKKQLRLRSTTIARTEASRAVSDGTLTGYEQAGVMAEWYNRGEPEDDTCSNNDGQIFTIAEARGLIPVHPNCICGWAPVVPETPLEIGI